MTAQRRLTDNETRTLKDILAFSAVAARLVERGREAYDSDEMLPLAAEAILIKIGEAVSRLPEAVIAASPHVRWRSMRGMRNLLAHDYEAIDPNIIWNTLARELPVDAVAIRAVVGDGRNVEG